MQSESIKTLGFLGRQQQCVLPIFQRKYAWEKNSECKTLFENLVYIGGTEQRDSWYLGAIVCQNKGGNLARPKYVLIDGQQRLTTLTIMICAITEYLRKHPKTKLEEVKNWDSLLKSYVINTEEEGDKWYKLLLNNEDNEDLKELIYKVSIAEDILKYKGKSNVFSNYHFFKRCINKNNIHNLYDGLRKLEMILINLDEKDVAQNIFETLNSTGKSLRQIDQIKNYLLMGLNQSEAKELFYHYWRPMENSFDDYQARTKSKKNHFDYFTRYYLIIKLNKNITSKAVYDKFRLVSDNFENAKTCIKELNEYSQYYLRLFGDCEDDPILKKEFSDLNVIKMRLMSPFLMVLYKYYVENLITKEEFIEIFKMLKSHYIRRSLCGWVGNNGLDAVALKLTKIIKQGGKLKEIKECLCTFKGNDRFLSDEQVKDNVLLQNFKDYPKNHFILNKLVNLNQPAPLDTSELDVVYLYHNVSEEHIDKLGNCTLEGIDLCMDIDANSNEEFIDKRTELLTEMILRVWDYPKL